MRVVLARGRRLGYGASMTSCLPTDEDSDLEQYGEQHIRYARGRVVVVTPTAETIYLLHLPKRPAFSEELEREPHSTLSTPHFVFHGTTALQSAVLFVEDSLHLPFSPELWPLSRQDVYVGPFLDVEEDGGIKLKFDTFVARHGKIRSTRVTRYELLEVSGHTHRRDIDFAISGRTAISADNVKADIAAWRSLTLNPLYSFVVKGFVEPDRYFTSMIQSENRAIGGIIMRPDEQNGWTRSTAIYSISMYPTLLEDKGPQPLRQPELRRALVPRLDRGKEGHFWSVCWTSGRMVGSDRTRCVIISLL